MWAKAYNPNIAQLFLGAGVSYVASEHTLTYTMYPLHMYDKHST